MKNVKLLILPFILLSAMVWTSQNGVQMDGKVTDFDNGKFIANAEVILKDHISQTIIKTTKTNQNGDYVFTEIPNGSYNLEIKHSDYFTYSHRGILVNNKQKAKIQMNFRLHASSAIELEEVQIKECKESAPLNNHASGHTITRQDISVLPVRGSRSNSQRVGNPNYNNQKAESYAVVNHNGFKAVETSPLSTFSIDVDAASYSVMRRHLMEGKRPPQDAVRIEEMINYFSYDYKQPKKDEPFSITTMYGDCPWNENNKLVHIGLQGRAIEKENLPASNLVFLIDVSGSMYQANRLPLVKKSLRMLVNELNPTDKVAMVVYAGAAGEVLPSTPASEKEKIFEAIDQLKAGGSTAGGAGIKLAYKVAQDNFMENGNNRVIICTDGDFNVGASSDSEMHRLIETYRSSGVFLTCLGYGMGNYKDSKLEILANKGNGNYAYIDDLLEAKKVLITEMGATLVTLAKDVKIQVEFNPAHISSYRLIGYENRLLNDEDFNDDTKDAGELGAGHSVTALYEVVPASESDKKLVDPLKYQESSLAKLNQELLTVKFRYKNPKGIRSKLLEETVYAKDHNQNLTNDFHWSAAVSMFGLNLRNDELAPNKDLDKIIALAQNSRGKDEQGYRASFIQLIELAKKIDKDNTVSVD